MLGLTTMAGCARRPGQTTRSRALPTTPTGGPDAYAFTHLRPDGNRFVDGTGQLPTKPVDVPVDGTPAWVLGIPSTPTRWVLVREDGMSKGFTLKDGQPRSVPVTPPRLPAAAPPVATADTEGVQLLSSSVGSALTHPFPLTTGRALVVGDEGALLLIEADEVIDRLALDCPPDARVVRAGEHHVVLSGATTRYDHSALGDGVEAAGFTRIDVSDGLSAVNKVALDRAVIEGIAPFAGLGGLIVTETDSERGARVVLYEGVERTAIGPAVGQGYRWRHQLAVAPFAPDGTAELAVVKTPHIGGTVEFYRRAGDRLQITASLSDASSHAYRSRNLDGAVAGDFDGDGRVELLLPDDARERLRAIRRTRSGAQQAWALSLGGALTTNVHAVRTPSGVAVAAGTDGTVRVWE